MMAKNPAWKVLRFLLIWSGIIAIPRLWLQGAPLMSWDVAETAALAWERLGWTVRWFGAKTGLY